MSDIYAQRVDTTGTLLWNPEGVAICTAIATQDQMQICNDGTGGAIITWIDNRKYDGDVYTQKINSKDMQYL